MEVVTSNNITIANLDEDESSFISVITYDSDSRVLGVLLKGSGEKLYKNVSRDVFNNFLKSESKGSFYNNHIKQKFKFMAKQNDRGEVRSIKIKIDVSKIEKAWLFKGEKGMYLDCSLVLYENEDIYGQHGFVVQSVPKEIAKANPGVRGQILGNAKDFTNYERAQLPKAEEEVGELKDDIADDLPF